MDVLKSQLRLLGLVAVVLLVLGACAEGGGDTAGEAAGEVPDEPAADGGTDPPATEPGDAPEAASGDPIPIANTFELSGAGSSFGTKWGRGVQLAVEEINESGGILGRPLELDEYDTQSEPPVSVTALRRAMQETDPFILFGPVFSSSAIVNMEIAQQAGLPQFTGGESPAITEQGNEYIFQTSYDSGTAFRKVATYLEEDLGAEQIALLFQNDEFGQGAREAIVPLLEEAGIEIVEDIATEVGQTDFAGEAARILNSGADTLLVVLSDEEAGRMHQGFEGSGVYDQVNFLGINPVVQSTALDLAGNAADGARGIVDFSPAVPELQDITDTYVERWGPGLPDHNFFKGYFGVYMMKLVLEEVGELDREAFIDTLHDSTWCASDHPELRGNSVYYGPDGRPDRDSYLVEVVDGQQQVLETVGPLQTEKFEECS